MTSYDLTISGEAMTLLPQKALHWPGRKVLIVADIHFGKAAAFRRQGIPVPQGTTTQNIAALDTLVQQLQVESIVFLGDFLHARETAASSLRAMLDWRLRHPRLHLLLVRGNHDLKAGDPPSDMALQIVDEPHRLGPFALCHHPDLECDAYVLAGHVHPAYRVSGRGESYRLPCFVVGGKRAILPSFGAFTGAHTITRESDDKIYVVAEDDVIAIPFRQGSN